jgi:hypothetical protein
MVANEDKPENADKDDVVIKRDPEIVKRETAALAKKKSDALAKRKTAELEKKTTGELDEHITQLVYGYSFTKEETAWLVVFVLVILAPNFLPDQFLNDNQITILLFVILPVVGWLIRLIYLDAKQRGG